MSFKDGIPLLTAFSDEEDDGDEEFTVSTLPQRRKKINKRHVLFCVVLLSALFLIVAMVIGVTVPVVLVKQASNGGNVVNHTVSSTINSSMMITPSSALSNTSMIVTFQPPSIMPTSTVSMLPSVASTTPSPPSIMPTSTAATPPSIMPTSTATTTPSIMPTSTPVPYNLHQSRLDTRDYHVMTLNNQLRVLLISDPHSSVAAASMDIAAGSFDDPIDALGLAHFCEHMLFLGTKKYPDEKEYSEYLTQHGGYDNAYTSSENTNYHFQVQSDYLKMSLDRFAQFFIAPLLTASGVDREKNAVNAEYRKDKLIEGWRTYQVTKDVSNPQHPFHQFSVGNLETLSGDNLHETLWNFYHTHYSSNRMQLVVYGRDDIATLTNWTLNSFSSVSNRNLSPPLLNTTSFPPPFNRRIIYYYPVADTNSLSINWQVPSLEKKYRNDISGFISRYLGQEDVNSVLYLLKKEGLATSLSAGVQIATGTFTLLNVDIGLTEAGLKSVSRVIQAVHWNVELLRGMNKSEFVGRFAEYRGIKQNVFDYGEKATALEYIKSLASGMRVIDSPEDFLSSPERLLPNYTLFLSTLDCMVPSNALVLLSSQQLNISTTVSNVTGISSQGHPELVQTGVKGHIPWPVELNMYEYFFEVPYTVENISTELADFWSTKGSGFDALKLPGANSFVVSNLTLEKKPNNSTVPTMIANDEGISLWSLLDTNDFPEPRVNLNCDIRSSNTESSILQEAYTLLFTSVVMEELITRLYSATEVGYTFSLSPTPSGVYLSISGVSNHDNMRSILGTMLDMLLDNKTQELFDITKMELIDQLNNYNKTEQPYRYTRFYIQRVLLNRPYWKKWQLLEQMVNLTQDDVQSFASQFLSNVSLLCLSHGNINDSTAQSYEGVLRKKLIGRLTGGGVVGMYYRSRVQLTSNTSYGVSMETLNPDDTNSVVHIVHQVGSVCELSKGLCGRDSLLNKLHLLLLSQMISNECFSVLRTEQQLGYVVWCYSSEYYNIGSFQVLIQSPNYNGSVVYERINNFLSYYYNTSLSPASLNKTFNDQVTVLQSTLQDFTLEGRTNRLWGQVDSGQMQFDYYQELIDIIKEGSADFSADSLRRFYNDYILSGRKLVTVLYGKGKEFPLPENLVPIDYSNFNQTAHTFPV